LPQHGALELEHLADVDGIPSAEGALPDGAPEQTPPDRDAAAALRVVQQGLLEVRELAERADARDLPEHPVEERAAAPAASSDVQDPDPHGGFGKTVGRHRAGVMRDIRFHEAYPYRLNVKSKIVEAEGRVKSRRGSRGLHSSCCEPCDYLALGR